MVKRSTVWKKNKQKDNKGAKIAIGIFLGLLMIFSVFGIVSSFGSVGQGSSQTIQENGVRFIPTERTGVVTYRARLNDVTYEFGALPSQLSQFSVNQEARRHIQNDNIRMTFVPSGNNTAVIDGVRLQLAIDASQTGEVLSSGIVEQTQDGTYSSLPVVTCNDATQDAPVILFKYDASSQLTTNGSCVIAQAVSQRDMALLGEYVRYVRLGVI